MSDRFLAPSDVLRKFDGTRVTRDLLYRWAIKRWIDAQQVDRGDNHAYVYPESGLWKIGRLAWAYALGLEPNHAERFATEINEDSATRENDFLRDEFEKVFNAVASITQTALSLTCDLQPLSDRALQLLEAEHCAVFLVPGEEYRNARNPARHMEKQAETPRRDLCGGFQLP